MPGYKDVIEAIHECPTPQEVMRRLKMPPCRLRKVLRSPRFRRQMEVEKLLMRAAVQYRASSHAMLAVACLGELALGSKEEAVRKASMAILSRAVDMDIVPDRSDAKGLSEPTGPNAQESPKTCRY